MNEILQGHALNVLKTLPDESVQCIITSPPYWGLRSYKTEPQVWGGNPECKHEWVSETRSRDNRYSAGLSKDFDTKTGSGGKFDAKTEITTNFCSFCSAWRGELGLEPSIELFTQHITEIFHEAKRVLRRDGTLWLNLGDSYASNGSGSGQPNSEKSVGSKCDNFRDAKYLNQRNPKTAVSGLKPKDLCGIPWRIAFALQAGFSQCQNCRLELPTNSWPVWSGHKICIDCERKGLKGDIRLSEDGWYLRSDIIWNKPNPMPESVTDRPTKSHEYIFLMSKSQKYYYDANAVREKEKPWILNRHDGMSSARNIGPDSKKEDYTKQNYKFYDELKGANARSVWTFATAPYKEAHFATFPPELVRRCMLAGSKEGDVILDPFMGSGTVALVALRGNRHYLGIELQPEYIKLAEKRIAHLKQQGVIL